MNRHCLWIVLLPLLTACLGGNSSPDDVSAPPDATNDLAEVAADDALDATPDAPALPPRVCRTGTAWAGQQAFSDVTATSSLAALGVTGVRVTAVDFDGDGQPDLAVRNHALAVRDDFGPEGIRYTWLLRSLGDFQFEDVTVSSGFAAIRDGARSGDRALEETAGRTTHIVVWADVDNDGDLDAFSGVATNPDPAQPDNDDRSEILINDGTGHFSLGSGGDFRYPQGRPVTFGAAFTDFDRDGFVDLWLGFAMGREQPGMDRLFRGDGTGLFSDVTASMGLSTKGWSSVDDIREGRAHRNTWGVTACDLDGDGRPELLSSVYGRYFNALWQGGDGGYVDASMASGFAADEDLDWTTNLNAQCYCKLHPDAPDCAGVPAPPSYFGCSPTATLRWDHDYDREAWRLGGNTFTTACGDMDNDGDMDLVNFEIQHWDVGSSSDATQVLYNDGAAVLHFTRPGVDATGLSRDWDGKDWNAGDMTGAIFDFDNDGRQDLLIGSSDYPGTRAFLFRQCADGTFEEVPAALGIDHPRSHGVAVADLDADGDLDVVLGHGTSRCSGDPSCYATAEVHAFRNDLGQDGNWLRIRLEGAAGSNRAGIGARVRVTAGGVTQTREVGGGYGHLGIQNELVLHFGLGDACDVDRVEVRWPDAANTIETFDGVRANYRIEIRQGQGAVRYLD